MRRTSLELSIEMHRSEDSEEYGTWQNPERYSTCHTNSSVIDCVLGR